jgi:hypothetical protein
MKFAFFTALSFGLVLVLAGSPVDIFLPIILIGVLAAFLISSFKEGVKQAQKDKEEAERVKLLTERNLATEIVLRHFGASLAAGMKESLIEKKKP